MARFHISISKLPGSNVIVGSVTYTHYLGIIQLNLFTVLDCDRHYNKRKELRGKKSCQCCREIQIFPSTTEDNV